MTSSQRSTSGPAGNRLPAFADIEDAATRLAGHAVVTPLLELPTLNERVGGRVLLKAETLQRTGSFKFRGAFNRISRIPEPARAAGVVAYSSGNHAQGVAAAAKLLGLQATIVMPSDAPRIKIENTRGYGARIVTYDRTTESREAIGEALAKETSALLVRHYDDLDIITGQGTCGLEIAHQAAALDAVPEQALICCGGGGLTAGVALALETLVPSCAIYSVEPEEFDDTRRSLATGERVAVDPQARSFCDALLTPMPGETTFALNRRLLAGGLVVSDREVRQAMAYAFRHLKLVVEPGGAVSLAALLSGKIEAAGRTSVVLLSGGNVDPAVYATILEQEDGG
jgi:threonine dehydratase